MFRYFMSGLWLEVGEHKEYQIVGVSAMCRSRVPRGLKVGGIRVSYVGSCDRGGVVIDEVRTFRSFWDGRLA